MIESVQTQNWKMKLLRIPVEDSYAFDRNLNISAVADGVSRDLANGRVVRKNIFGAIDAIMNYQRPSPAKAVSEFAVKHFVEKVRKYGQGEITFNNIMKEISEGISDWNSNNMGSIDYLANDYAGCTFAGGALHKDTLTWVQICDAGVAILDKDGNLKFRTENDGPAKHDEYIWGHEKMKGLTWDMPEARRHVRGYFRNNVELRDRDKPSTFGVLTGEDDALYFVRTGQRTVEPEDSILFYTDGMEEVIYNRDGDVNGEFADSIRNRSRLALEEICRSKVKTEGTLLYQ